MERMFCSSIFKLKAYDINENLTSVLDLDLKYYVYNDYVIASFCWEFKWRRPAINTPSLQAGMGR